jgi:cold shock CspA family protein
MAKSRETYNKKEKEKQKLKKKLEKEEKKEARKSNSNKDSDFEGMIAYVDENGNISSTPPDPTKKVAIDASNIQIGIPRQAEAEPLDVIRTGTVTFFNESKGYGFIKDQETQESVFVHMKGLIDAIQDRDKVTFEVEMTPRGPSAFDVKLVK